MGQSPEMRKHMLGTLQLGAEKMEFLGGKAAKEGRSVSHVEQVSRNHRQAENNCVARDPLP